MSVTRSSITQVSRVGIETTEGVAVPANRQFLALSIEPSPKLETDQFRPQGLIFKTIVAPSKQWTEASYEGRPSYTELPYLLSALLCAPVIETPEASENLSPTLRRWTWTPSSSQIDPTLTLTLEHGDPVRAAGASNLSVPELGLTFNSDSAEISGSLFGGEYIDDIVMSDPDLVEYLPEEIAFSTQFSVYADFTPEALGTTLLTDLNSGEWKMDNRKGPVWTVNSRLASFKKTVGTEPGLTASLTMEANEQGMSFYQTAKKGQTIFVRIEAQGRALTGGQKDHANLDRFLLRIDTAFKIADIDDPSDEDGVYEIGYALEGVHDAGWGKALQVVIQNEQTEL